MSQGQKVQKKVATRQPCGAVSLRGDAAQRDLPHGRRELCTLSSAQLYLHSANMMTVDDDNNDDENDGADGDQLLRQLRPC